MASEVVGANSQHDFMTSSSDVVESLKAISQFASGRTLIIENVRTVTDWARCEIHLNDAITSQTPVCVLVSHDNSTTIPERWLISRDIHVVDSSFPGNVIESIQETAQYPISLIVINHHTTSDPELNSRRARVESAVARADRSAIWTKTFRADPRRWISLYNQVGERDLYLWQWCLHGIEITTLPNVQKELFNDIVDLKLLSVIICVLFDDVADRSHDNQWLRELINVVQSGTTSFQLDEQIREHVEIAHELWQAYSTRVRALPGYAELESV